MGTWFGGGFGSARLMDGHNDLKSPFQPKFFYYVLYILCSADCLALSPVEQNYFVPPLEVDCATLPLTNIGNCGFEYLKVEKNYRHKSIFHVC